MKDNCTDKKLILDNVSHGYGTLAVLQNLHLQVRAGEFVVVVGPSGCGKSTLLNVLSGYIKPHSGLVQREGLIRTVYQQDSLFPWLTVAENISMGLRQNKNATAKKQDLQKLFDLIHLEAFKNHYPHQLSGGMRQRVELARVLAGDSDILLMDEPFSALDYQERLRMRSELIRLLKERPKTVVFVTHDIEEAAQLANRVLILSNRPATICRELTIDSPRPRDPADEEVVRAMKIILSELGLQSGNTMNG